MSARFEENFWGEGNRGFEVLMQNMRAGVSASKELGEFIRERAAVEDTYVKGINKLHKTFSHVPESLLGAFNPMWKVLKQMCEEIASIHANFVQQLTELSREIAEYNVAQRDKLKVHMKGEIDATQESLQALESCDVALLKTKKVYEQTCEQTAKLQGKLEKNRADSNANPKQILQFESRVKQAETWKDAMKTDHQGAVQRHCDHLMEFQGKMHEACMKFESLEEEHLAQMVTFMIKIAQVQDSTHVMVERVYSTVNVQLNTLSVEKLLTAFVEARGTGREKPKPFKFRPFKPEGSSAVAVTASQEDLRPPSPSTGIRTASKGEKGFRSRFIRKLGLTTKAATVDGPGTNGPVPVPTVEEDSPEVDAEGYSIRPDDAARISQFPDDPRAEEGSDSDSDSNDEPEMRIRRIQIKPAEEAHKVSLSEIKASVQALRLTSPVPEALRKATSSQSLNMLATPPTERRRPSTDAAVSSLLDLDINPPTEASMPAPLLPTFYDPHVLLSPLPDPTATLKPVSIQSPPLLPAPVQPRPSPDQQVSVAASKDAPPSPRPIPKPRTSSTRLTPPPSSSTPSPLLPPLPSKRRTPTVAKEGDSAATIATVGGSPQNSPSSVRADLSSATDSPNIGDTPPVPAPRRQSMRRRPSTPQNLDVVNAVSPLATNQLTAPPPVMTSSSPVMSPSSSTRAISPSPGAIKSQAIPIAVAFQETCNAIFKGADLSQCLAKVTGEVMVSFSAQFLSQVESCDPLVLRLGNTGNVERVLHNQFLLKREANDFSFKFDMQALASQLKQMAEKHQTHYYNLQILKYEVKSTNPVDMLPLLLIGYWKCELATTNFRLDYTYTPAAFAPQQPTLTNVSVTVPVSGGVKNVLSRPTGTWEEGVMKWKLEDLKPATQPGTLLTSSLHAKFEVTNGPSVPASATVQFVCDGGNISGLTLEVPTPSYRISLLKNKCTAGKYIAEIK